MILFVVYLYEENGKENKKYKEKVAALKKEEYLRQRKFLQACREIWAAKRMIWIQKKIPYDFLSIVEGDEGECLVKNWAIFISSGSFYWTGKEIIPEHPAFSGQYDPSGRGFKDSYGSSGYDYIPMYPAENWKRFWLSITFYDHRKRWICENLMENYDHNYNGECLKKCNSNDGSYLINNHFEKCFKNQRKTKYNYHPSRLIQSAIHPDIYLIIRKNSPPYIERSDELIYTLRDWPYEPLPRLKIFTSHDKEKLKLDFYSMTDIELSQYIPTVNRFIMGSQDKFYFPYGFANYHGDSIELSDVPLFLLHLRNYLSEIYINDLI